MLGRKDKETVLFEFPVDPETYELLGMEAKFLGLRISTLARVILGLHLLKEARRDSSIGDLLELPKKLYVR
jgi:hypothetical protein